MRGILVLFAIAALACGDDDAPQCASPADCDEGNVCINGRCLPADTDAGVDAGDAGVDGSADARADAPVDAGMDVTDAGVDTAVDAPPDTFDAGPLTCPGPGGADDEPIVLYTFRAPDSAVTITDRAPATPDVPLTVNTGSFSVDNSGSGSVSISGGRVAATQEASDLLVSELVAAGSVTVEVWFTEADTVLEESSGPERIVTLSLDSGERAFTIGQEVGTDLGARFKTSTTLDNGIYCDEPTVGDARPPFGERIITDVMDGSTPKHVVLTFDEGDGQPVLYLNGVAVGGVWPCRRGTLDWATGLYRLALGDEFVDTRTWDGTVHRVAIYARAMSAAEVSCWHGAGPDADVFLGRD